VSLLGEDFFPLLEQPTFDDSFGKDTASCLLDEIYTSTQYRIEREIAMKL